MSCNTGFQPVMSCNTGFQPVIKECFNPPSPNNSPNTPNENSLKSNYMKLFHFMLAGCLAASTLVSCSDDDKEKDAPDVVPTAGQGAYVLLQGNMGANIQGELDFYDVDAKRLESKVFYKANGRYLGDTPQCGIRYGSKVYVGM